MDRFIEMRVFASVVECGSFIGAVELLDVSRAAVSRHVASLEDRLGVRLLHRTTRRVSPTAEGERFYQHCKSILAQLEEAETEISEASFEAKGELRISVPVALGLSHLAEAWAGFRQQNPKVTLDISLNDRITDIVEEGYDLAIRISQMPPSSLISRKVSSTRVVLCASPEYLEREGRPAQPADLVNHATISYSLMTEGDSWQFTDKEGKPFRVQVHPCIRANNGEVCRIAALQHQGIILQPTFIVGADLKAGRLEEVLPAYRSRSIGIHLVYPNRKHLAPKVRILIDYLADWFSEIEWDYAH